MSRLRRIAPRLLAPGAVAVAIAVGAPASHALAQTTCLGQPATIVGTDGNDSLNGTSGVDVIAGLGGDDLIRGLDGSDVICGGDGNDGLFGSNGGGYVDVVSGDAGDDRIDGGSAFGGIVAYVEAPDAITVSLEAGTATGWGNDQLLRIRGVLGSRASDTITGSPSFDLIAPLTGDDVVDAGAGSDTVLADAGNDRLAAGPGVDTIDFSGASRGITANLATRRASGAGNDRLSGFENVSGTKFADLIVGNAARNRLVGGAGGDRLFGGSGRDSLFGQQGRDYTDGGPGKDACSAEVKRRCP